MTEQEFADAVNQDMDEATCAQLDEEEIVQQVKRQRVETDSTEDDEQEEDDAEPQISKSEFTDAMKTVWLFLQQNSLEEARIKAE